MERLIVIIRWLIRHPIATLIGLFATIFLIGVAVSLFGGDGEPGSGGTAVTGVSGSTGPTSETIEPIGGGGSDDNGPQIPARDGEQPTEKAESDTPDSDPSKPAPDRWDSDTPERAEVERQLDEQPAVQALPLNRSGISADISDVLPDRRLVITVRYSGSPQEARAIWTAFLRKNGDSGKGYVVVFVPR